MATWLAFDVSATRREPARASRNRSGSRHSSTSGAGPERENLYEVWSITIAIVPCFSRPVADRPGRVDARGDDLRRGVGDVDRLLAHDARVAIRGHGADALAVQRAHQGVVVGGEVEKDLADRAGDRSGIGDVAGWGGLSARGPGTGGRHRDEEREYRSPSGATHQSTPLLATRPRRPPNRL